MQLSALQMRNLLSNQKMNLTPTSMYEAVPVVAKILSKETLIPYKRLCLLGDSMTVMPIIDSEILEQI